MREMTDDERDLEQKRLEFKVNKFLGADMNGRTVEAIEDVVKDHRHTCRLRGMDFPELAVIVLPVIGSIDVVSRDLDQKGIETLIVNLAKKYPAVSAAELGFAINRAFPGYAKMVDAARRHSGWAPH